MTPANRSANLTLPSWGGAWAQPLTGPLQITDATAMSLPVANRCVQIIADTIASLPLEVYRDGELLEPTPAIAQRLDPAYTLMESLSSIVVSLLLRGNAYGVVAERDYLGYPTALVIVDPMSVVVKQDRATGRVTYRIGGRTLDPEDVLHVRGLSLPGHVCGFGVLDMHRRTLGQSIAAEDYASELWTTGALPDVALTYPGDMTRDEADDVRRSWIARHGGRKREPAVLAGGLGVQQLSWSNVDLEFLESRRWNAQQICQMFGVPPIFAHVPSGESKTYQNVQQDTRAFTQYTLRPWLSRIESALTDMRPRGQTVVFNLDDLLRADMGERFNAYATAINAKFMDPLEANEREGMRRPPPKPQPIPDALAANMGRPQEGEEDDDDDDD